MFCKVGSKSRGFLHPPQNQFFASCGWYVEYRMQATIERVEPNLESEILGTLATTVCILHQSGRQIYQLARTMV